MKSVSEGGALRCSLDRHPAYSPRKTAALALAPASQQQGLGWSPRGGAALGRRLSPSGPRADA